MPSLNETEAQIKISSKYDDSGQKQAESGMAKLGSKIQDAGAAFGKLGGDLTVGVTLPIVGGLTIATKSAMDFNQQMLLLQTQAGASKKEVDDMKGAIMAMGGNFAQSPEDLAKALYHIESAGLRGKDALLALQASAEGATVGNANLEDVTNAMVATMSSGISGIKGSEQAMGVLNATVGAGNMRMADLTQAMSTGILPSAKAFGLSLQDVGTAIATMTDNGVPAIDAATRLRMTFSLMAAPTTKAQGALASIGITSNQLADEMRSKGLIVALQDLQTHLKKSGEDATAQAQTISEAFGGGRTSSAILTLLGNLDKMSTISSQIKSGTNDLPAAFKSTMEDPATKAAVAQAQLQSTLIEIGQTTLPMVAKVMDTFSRKLKDLSDWWDSLNPKTQEFYLKTLLVLAAVGPLFLAFAKGISVFNDVVVAVKSLQAIMAVLNITIGLTPIGWIILGVAGLSVVVYELVTHWKEVTNALKEAWKWFDNLHGPVATLTQPLRLVGDAIGLIVTHFQEIKTLGGDAMTLVGSLFKKMGFASGGSFIIPQGFNNDSFPLGGGYFGQSGERVTVTPANQVNDAGQSINITQYNNLANDLDVNMMARALGFELKSRLT